MPRGDAAVAAAAATVLLSALRCAPVFALSRRDQHALATSRPLAPNKTTACTAAPAVPQLPRPTSELCLQSLLMRSDGVRRWIRLLHLDARASLVSGRAMSLHTLTVGLRRALLNHLVTRWLPVTPLAILCFPLLQIRLLGSQFGSSVRLTFI